MNESERSVMLLVTKVEVADVPGREAYIASCKDLPVAPDFVPINNGDDCITGEVYLDNIRGREFVDQRGRRICIGMTKEAQEVLGLQYQCWENTLASLERLRVDLANRGSDLVAAHERLRRIKTASFWDRLRWLFVGVDE
jgi:hypothetical protein